MVVVAGTAAILTSGPAQGAGAVDCPPDLPSCIVTVDTPGAAGQGPGQVVPASAGGRVCVVGGTGVVVPCFDPQWGWFNSQDACYYRLKDPQPAPGDLAWGGHYPGGAIYLVTCTGNISGTNGGWTWLPTAPDGYGATAVTPGELAARAVDQMQLAGPAIGISITPGKTGLVGIPVWLWTAVGATTWGPNAATATVPGLSVTANARAERIAWDMGDGATVTCANPGTPLYPGGVESPTCQYIYKTSSAGQPNDAYTVTATTTWVVTWAGGGTSGSLMVTRASSTTVRIGELQVLVTG
jgi:hypothetical protein